MSTATATTTKPTLRDILLDSLEDAYWFRKGEVEDCPACRRNPAGVCADLDHQNASVLAQDYEEARKQLQRNPECPEVLAVLAGIEGGEGA